ncbi:hypothetical protein FACS1894125_5830 [Actinomycetota bacterium]|nr:hypothetical protein FACS1894125_5830 [Actinomycetota bacterium]
MEFVSSIINLALFIALIFGIYYAYKKINESIVESKLRPFINGHASSVAFSFSYGEAVFYQDHFTYNYNQYMYSDLKDITIEDGFGYFQFAIFRTDTKSLLVNFTFKDDSEVKLYRKGRSIYGIGTTGIVKRQKISMEQIKKHILTRRVNEKHK